MMTHRVPQRSFDLKNLNNLNNLVPLDDAWWPLVMLRNAFKKKNDKTYGKFHILGWGVFSEGSFSIC